MNYPLISEYIEAIKSAEDNFDELSYLRSVLGDDGLPVMTSGNFAVVFKMKDERDGKLYAVKCFTKEQEGRTEAYRQITEELKDVSSPYLTSVCYLDKELFVDTEQTNETEFPVLLMDWVEGKTLDKYLRENLDDKYALEMLAYRFSQLAQWLIPQPFAHGDLKPDNILVCENGTIVLVDYDGMYVPAMKGQKARELGSPDFRHPQRTENDFDEHIDDFPIALIAMALKAFSINPELLNEYCNNDIMFFTEKDYSHIHATKAMMAILEIVDNEELCSLFGTFMIALSKGDLSFTSPKMFALKSPKTGENYGEYIYNQARNLCEKAKDKSKIDHNKAFRLFQKAARLGHPDAQCCLGCCYKHGYGTQVDYTTAGEWYDIASRNGCARALRHIAMCYEYGLGKEKDIYKAIDYYLEAANKGDYYSYVCIGKAYESGTDVTKDIAKAFEYFTKAANNGDAEGQRCVGVCYHAGQGVERDYDKGIYWLEQSANQNDSLAQKLLGYCFYNGDGVKQNYEKAAQWYRAAAENGNIIAQRRIGLCYLNGIGVMQNDQEAFKWFEKAAVSGDSEALRLLGSCFYLGRGTPRNYSKAVELYLESANKDNKSAKYNLGLCFEKGNGVVQDFDIAKEWYEQAARQGRKKAQEALKRMGNDNLPF